MKKATTKLNESNEKNFKHNNDPFYSKENQKVLNKWKNWWNNTWYRRKVT